MSIQKQYLKSRPVCKVTFRIAEETGHSSRTAHLVGEFNDWSVSALPMRRLKSGAFTVTVDLKRGEEYQFRYLLDHHRWENEPEADRFAPSPFSDARNSVVCL
ncbi:MAG: isoamylase early set domain-containing protein [Desulfobacterales bacterium]|jgi:1,4-alpha-glucan branching enzyme